MSPGVGFIAEPVTGWSTPAEAWPVVMVLGVLLVGAIWALRRLLRDKRRR